MLKRLLICLFFLLNSPALFSQVLGGERAFEFLRLSQSPHITALGGLAVINPAQDVMMGNANPALLRESFHTNLGLNYNLYYGGTKVMNMLYAHHSKKLKTTFGLGIQYLDYGSFQQTNSFGFVFGEQKAADYSINLMASKSYLEKWRGGVSMKFAQSRLAQLSSFGFLMDVGVAYADTAKLFYWGLAVKNVGYQFKKYNPMNPSQPMPLDVQMGIMKKFKKAPFSFSILGHHLYTWDVRYDNPADIEDNILIIGDSTMSEEQKSYFVDKLFRHLVFAADINLGKRLEISAGYNHLRRSELSLTAPKGLSGFSYGVGLYLNKFTLHVAQSHYHITGAYTEVGLNMQLNRLFGIGGEFGKKINWSEKFATTF